MRCWRCPVHHTTDPGTAAGRGGHGVETGADTSIYERHAYVVVIMDWCSRWVLASRLWNILDTSFRVDALHEALSRFRTWTMFNTDQGAQFTSMAFLTVLRGRDIQVGIDGQGCWCDNVMIERLWRSLKYECALLHALQDSHEARQRIGACFVFYNYK